MPDPDPVPGLVALREAALLHLARYACSAAGLTRVLDRRIDRWARGAEAPAEQLREARASARDSARKVVAKLVEAGVLDDAGFAAARARSLARAGRSRRAISAHLAVRGVAAETAAQALPDDPEHDLAAALTVARRRRIGPFRTTVEVPDLLQRRRELAALARGGFPEELARRALGMDAEAAEALLIRRRREG